MECSTLCHEFECSRKVVLEAGFQALVDLLQAVLNLVLAPLPLYFDLLLLSRLPAERIG